MSLGVQTPQPLLKLHVWQFEKVLPQVLTLHQVQSNHLAHSKRTLEGSVYTKECLTITLA